VSQLFKWRKELCKRTDTSVAGLMPVKIVRSPPKQVEESSTAAASRRRKKDGIIEIELASGYRVRVDFDVDVDALRRVLDALVRR